MTRHTKRRVIRLAATGAAISVVATLGINASVQAATPDAGTVSTTSPSLTWEGQHYAAAASVDSAACLMPLSEVCDVFTLNADVPATTWDTNTGGIEVTVTWADASNDFDLYIYDAEGNQVASSAAGGTTFETAVISEPVGEYTVNVLPFAVVDSGYTGAATLSTNASSPTGPEGGLTGGTAAYHGVTVAGEMPATEPRSTPARFRGTYPSFQWANVGRKAAEPTVGVDKTGHAFYAAATFDAAGGFLARTEVRHSPDGGITWDEVTPQIGGQDVPPTTLDPYVYVDTDSGRVFNLDLYVGSSYLNFSDDQGQTWETNPAASGDFVNDHQTLYSGPAPAGIPTLDPDFPEIVYYCFNKVAESACGRSLDGGKTFLRSGLPAYEGYDPELGLCGGLHGHLKSDQDGRIFLPKGHCGNPFVAISEDAGLTWNRVNTAPNVPADGGADPTMAVDAAGNVYYTYMDARDKLPYLVVSKDHGVTWGAPTMIAPPGVHEVQFPQLTAGDDGRIAVSFVGTRAEDSADLTRPWDFYVTFSTDATSANPLWVSNIANASGDPVHRGNCPGRCGNMLDFLDTNTSPLDGSLWAAAVDTCVEECATNPEAEGFSDAGDGTATAAEGIAIRQLSGPSLVALSCTKRKCR